MRRGKTFHSNRTILFLPNHKALQNINIKNRKKKTATAMCDVTVCSKIKTSIRFLQRTPQHVTKMRLLATQYVCLSARNNSRTTERIFTKFRFVNFYRNDLINTHTNFLEKKRINSQPLYIYIYMQICVRLDSNQTRICRKHRRFEHNCV